MMESGKEYAQALFLIAKENSCEDLYLESLETVLCCFDENPIYLDFLSSVNISKNERLQAIEEAFSSSMPQHIVSFLKILCERERIRVFKDCVKEFKSLYSFSSKIVSAKIITAVKLEDSEKESVLRKLEKLKKCSVIAEYVVDPSIIGGMIIETDGFVIDNSIRSRLCEAKEVMNREQ